VGDLGNQEMMDPSILRIGRQRHAVCSTFCNGLLREASCAKRRLTVDCQETTVEDFGAVAFDGPQGRL
jgi:hypothetical protein